MIDLEQIENARRVIRTIAATLLDVMDDVSDEDAATVRFADACVGVQTGLELARCYPEFAALVAEMVIHDDVSGVARSFYRDVVNCFPIVDGRIIVNEEALDMTDSQHEPTPREAD